MTKFTLTWGRHRLELGARTQVMGIVNVTPDSFSDGGRFFGHREAVEHGRQLVREGADILDIGGESTRPFADPVSVDEEIRRVVPVVERLASQVSVPISVDTTKAEVARRALEAGAAIINDVSALRLDGSLADVAARAGVPVIVMHMLGTPRTMQVDPSYENLMGEIKTFLAASISRAREHGIDPALLIVDPGIGFGKSVAHNLQIIRRLEVLRDLDRPILLGPSRKSFLQKMFKNESGAPAASDSEPVAAGTQTAVTAAVLHGVHIVRVHDVARTVATLRVADAIKNA